jgi:DHA3 family macrolide efflux protein-like MFS transporter
MFRGIKAFVVTYIGQAISIVGSGLTSFAVNVWVYEHSRLATPFALLGLCSFLPGALALPFAGVITDRHDRRRTMLLCNVIAGIAIIVVALLQASNLLQIWLLCIVASIMSGCNALLNLTLAASVVTLVPGNQLARANGFRQIGPALARVISPSLAVLIFARHSVRRLFVIDGVSYFVAAALLLTVVIPVVVAAKTEQTRSFKRDLTHGWSYLVHHKPVMYLAFLMAINECAVQIGYLLMAPLVLRIGSPRQFGTMMSIIAAGVLAGSVVVSVRGIPKNKIRTIVFINLVEALAFFLSGLNPTFVTIVCTFGIFALCSPFGLSSADTLLQKHIDAAVQGRIFAAVRQLVSFSVPVAFLIAGPVVDHVLAPLTVTYGYLFHGAENGITLLFLILAVLLSSITLFVYGSGKLRSLQDRGVTEAMSLAVGGAGQ